jgi:hypothetical protein
MSANLRVGLAHFRSVLPLVLAMFDPKTHVLARSAIRFELVGDHDAGRFGRLLEKLSHEPLCGGSISPVLDENVENEALLIDGAP